MNTIIYLARYSSERLLQFYVILRALQKLRHAKRRFTQIRFPLFSSSVVLDIDYRGVRLHQYSKYETVLTTDQTRLLNMNKGGYLYKEGRVLWYS